MKGDKNGARNWWLMTTRQQNTRPVLRGRKLVLNYTDGSPCPDTSKRAYMVEDLTGREIIGDDDDKDKGKDEDTKRPASSVKRKSTIISMLCDRDPLMPLLTLSFIASPDECTYVFEARSSAACATLEQATQTLSPSGVFGVILVIALIVYLVGGCVYSRVVLQQRGWRQLPNYGLWAGIFGFFKVRGTLVSYRYDRSIFQQIAKADPITCRTS